MHACTVYGKTFEGENFHGFGDFLLNRECFTSNNLRAIGIHYQKELLPRKFSCEYSFSILTAKVFPLECFAVYGIVHFTYLVNYQNQASPVNVKVSVNFNPASKIQCK